METQEQKNEDYYTYFYLDPRKKGHYVYDGYAFNYEPFYVGKGKQYRYKSHLSQSYNNRDNNSFKCNVIRKIKKEINSEPIIFKIGSFTENDALQCEISFIKIIGRRNIKTGTLTNLTDGGEGISGYVFSDERKKAISESAKLAVGDKNPFHGKNHTKESKEKMSKAKKGIRMSQETKDKISKSNINKFFSLETRKKLSEKLSGKNNGMYGKTNDKNPFYGKKHTKETLILLSEKQKLRFKDDKILQKNRLQKTCRQVEIDGIIYQSKNDACRQLNISYGKLSNRLISNNFTNYKYI